MLHAWTILTLTFCAVVASLALLRGLAGLLVGGARPARLEALALALAGLAGWIGVALAGHVPR